MTLSKYFIKKYFLFSLSIILFIYYALFRYEQTNETQQNKIVQNDEINKKKYVVYECTSENLCGGWADRLKGL